MKYSFCASENVTVALANAALFLKDIDHYSMVTFLREIIDTNQKVQNYDTVYNMLCLMPREVETFEISIIS